MRRGCISLGDVQCDGCRRAIWYLERYLVEEEEGIILRLCLECASDRGYAHYQQEKGERIITFFPETEVSPEG
jgi:RNase P subunit RPR2